MLAFQETLRPYQMNDPLHVKWNQFSETAIPTCLDLQNKEDQNMFGNDFCANPK